MSSGSRGRYFPSQRVFWVAIPMWVLILWVLFAFPTESATPGILDWLGRGLIAGALLWLLYGTGYRVTDRNLVLCCGPGFLRIALDRIEAVAPCSYFMLTGIAWGLGTDTLKVDYRGGAGCARITPADKQGFLRTLAERCPQLELQDDRLVSVGD